MYVQVKVKSILSYSYHLFLIFICRFGIGLCIYMALYTRSYIDSTRRHVLLPYTMTSFISPLNLKSF